MDADQRMRLRALCSVDADPVRVHRADLADVLDALDAAERERDDARAVVEGRAFGPTDEERAAHDGEWLVRHRVAWDGEFVFCESFGDLSGFDGDGGMIAERWWPLDADGRPCAWPVAAPQGAVAGDSSPGTGERTSEPAGGPCAASCARDGGGS
jgi:hypothetical protein